MLADDSHKISYLIFIFEKAAKFEIVGHALRIDTDNVQYN